MRNTSQRVVAIVRAAEIADRARVLDSVVPGRRSTNGA